MKKMARGSFALASALVFSACASNPYRVPHECFRDSQVASLKTDFEHMADYFADQEGILAGSTVTLEDQCFKKEYARRTYVWAFMVNPKDLFDHVAFLRKDRPRELGTSACLKRAVDEIDALGVPYFSDLIDAYRREFGESVWNDSEFGPVQNLTCAKSEDPANYSALLGRLNSSLTNICVNAPAKSQSFCFDYPQWPQDVFEARVKMLEPGALADPVTAGWVDLFQELLRGPHAFRTISGELASDTVSLDVLTAEIQKSPAPKKLAREHTNDILLALNMDLLLAFVEQLRSDQPSAYKIIFGPDKKDRDSLQKLLVVGEQSLTAFFTELDKDQIPRPPGTVELWEKYQAAKKRLAL